jgi:hypothetical protein
MATLRLDYLSRAAARNLIDSVAGQKADAIRRIVGIRRSLRLATFQSELDGIKDLSDEALLGYAPDDYKIERADLEWLRDQLQAKDWSKRATSQGQEITMPVPAVFLEGVCNLMDAVADALMSTPTATK